MGLVEVVKAETMILLSKVDKAHGMEHINRVLDMAIPMGKIMNVESIDDVRIIAILHDVDDHKLFDNPDGKDLSNARKILDYVSEDYRFSEERKEKILSAISEIGYNKRLQGISPTSIEAMVISDADMLDGMGMTGVLRNIQYAKHKGFPFISDKFPRENLSYESYTENKDPDQNSAVNHMFEKQLRLKGMMMTAPGYREAVVRHEAMVEFLRGYFRENRLKRWEAYLDEFLTTRC